MSTRALAADGEQVEDSDTYISSALGFGVQAVLPVIDDGAGETVAVDTEMRFEATAAGYIEILDSNGHRVGIVTSRTQAVVVAQTGDAQTGAAQSWAFQVVLQTPAVTVGDGPADAVTDFDVAVALTAEATDSPDRAETNAALNAAGVKANANAVKQNLIAVALNAVIAALDNAGILKVE